MEMQDVRRKFEAFLEKGRKVSRIGLNLKSRIEREYFNGWVCVKSENVKTNVGPQESSRAEPSGR
jgi:hypothetical protein